MYIGGGVGWQRRCKTRQSLRGLDNQGTVFFSSDHHDGCRVTVDHIVRGGELKLRTRGMIASRSMNKVRHPQGSYKVIPIAVSGVATPENKVTYGRCHP